MSKSLCLNVVAASLCVGMSAAVQSPFFTVSFGSMTLESVEYDSTNSLLYYQDFLSGLIYYVTYDSDAIADGTFTLDDAAAFDNSDITVSYPTGMYSDGTYLYVCSATESYITVFDIASKTAVNTIELLYNGDETRTNGICNDPTSDDIIYVTSPGADFIVTGGYTNDSALYRINTTSGDYTLVADFGNDEHPNGCTVSSDGSHVYMVSFWLDGSGNFIRYKTSDETYSVLTGMESASGDGIIFDSDGNLYFTMWGTNSTNGKLYQFEDGFSTGSSVSFEVFANGLNNPADMCYDSGNDWAIIPNFDQSGAGSISWIDLSEDDDSSANTNMSTFRYVFVAIIVAMLSFI